MIAWSCAWLSIGNGLCMPPMVAWFPTAGGADHVVPVGAAWLAGAGFRIERSLTRSFMAQMLLMCSA
jgi:hypothetical protein